MTYTTEPTYTLDQVIELINNYKENFTVYTNLMKEYQDVMIGGNIAQYGEQAGMPKAQGTTSNLVWNELQRLIRQDKMISKYEVKVRYIQNRWDRVTDEKQAIILSQKLNGKSNAEIGKMLECDPRTVNKIVREIAVLLCD